MLKWPYWKWAINWKNTEQRGAQQKNQTELYIVPYNAITKTLNAFYWNLNIQEYSWVHVPHRGLPMALFFSDREDGSELRVGIWPQYDEGQQLALFIAALVNVYRNARSELLEPRTENLI